MKPTLRFVLGDQLTRGVSSLADIEPGDVVLMAEVDEEATYVRHHQRKIAFLFAAMRHFAAELEAEGIRVDYIHLDGKQRATSFGQALGEALKRHKAARVVVTEPGEWRVLEMMRGWEAEFGVPVELRPDDRFLCGWEEFSELAGDGPTLLMETFYRRMRERTGFLMTKDGKPEGGRWNYDAENRKPLPKRIEVPPRPAFEPDEATREVLDLVARRFGNHFGSLEDFDYPVTRHAAVRYLRWFVTTALPDFGTYEDAMRQGEPLLFHSHLSALINCGLLTPRECCEAVEAAYRNGKAPLNAAEGFIRQIIGWREFIRGVYWREMPGYGERNELGASRPLPDFFWTGETEMNCLAQAIGETARNAFAHHIQRLMVIGNFCLLAGLDPKEVQDWYLVVYHDAYEWVEMPNVVGMILYADGGVFATKPYAASGNYINKMSNYCGHCRYDVKQKTGEGACPFNYLYWDFMARHAERFDGNHRMDRTLATLGRMDEDKVATMRKDAERFLDGLVPAGDY
jgi:deoxyribodipyrimidine photolyase-related protein